MFVIGFLGMQKKEGGHWQPCDFPAAGSEASAYALIATTRIAFSGGPLLRVR
jgi:hypothetical protein